MVRSDEMAYYLNLVAFQTALDVQIDALRFNIRQFIQANFPLSARRIVVAELQRVHAENRDVKTEIRLLANRLGLPLPPVLQI